MIFLPQSCANAAVIRLATELEALLCVTMTIIKECKAR